MSFQEQLQTLRKLKGLSQEKLAGYNRNLFDEGVVNLKIAFTPIKELRFDI